MRSIKRKLPPAAFGELVGAGHLLPSWLARSMSRYRSDCTHADAKADVFEYIERFGSRRHSTIGYVSPIQFEQQMQLA